MSPPRPLTQSRANAPYRARVPEGLTRKLAERAGGRATGRGPRDFIKRRSEQRTPRPIREGRTTAHESGGAGLSALCRSQKIGIPGPCHADLHRERASNASGSRGSWSIPCHSARAGERICAGGPSGMPLGREMGGGGIQKVHACAHPLCPRRDVWTALP